MKWTPLLELFGHTKPNTNYMAKHHDITRSEIPEGEQFVIDRCNQCGVQLRRYRNGKLIYINERGRAINRPECNPAAIVVPITQAVQPAAQQVQPVAIPCQPLTGSAIEQHAQLELKARFSECLVMLRCAYDEIKEGRIRKMIRTYLDSQGYTQVLKELQSDAI